MLLASGAPGASTSSTNVTNPGGSGANQVKKEEKLLNYYFFLFNDIFIYSSKGGIKNKVSNAINNKSSSEAPFKDSYKYKVRTSLVF